VASSKASGGGGSSEDLGDDFAGFGFEAIEEFEARDWIDGFGEASTPPPSRA